MIDREHHAAAHAAAAAPALTCNMCSKHSSSYIHSTAAASTKRSSSGTASPGPGCSLILLLPFLFLFLCFSANKLLHVSYMRRDELREESNPCLIRASSYDQLQPFVPTHNSLQQLDPAAGAATQLGGGAAGSISKSTRAQKITVSPAAAGRAGERSEESAIFSGVNIDAAAASNVGADECQGKYIYTYPLPPEFNEELVERCNVGYKRYCDKWFCIPCNRLENYGFGPKVEPAAGGRNQSSDEGSSSVELIPKEAWFRSDQFSLEVIVYEKMKRHQCLTANPDEAAAFYIPYFGGLDMAFTLFSGHIHLMDELQHRLVGWLSGNAVWQRKGAHAPHFMVLGHVAWDFDRRPLQGDTNDDGTSSYTWGSSLFHQPLLTNISWLLIERKGNQHDMGLPFPTLFHPSSPTDIFLWQEEIRKAKRPWLVTFVGGSRRHFDKEATRNVRQVLMRQCHEAEQDKINSGGGTLQKCKALECIGAEEMRKKRSSKEPYGSRENIGIEREIACDEEPEEVVKALTKSVFCMQPKGDSATRKGFFDTIVAGCIPVLFANDTAYLQYIWHLPTDPSLYSVFVPEAKIAAGQVNVVEVLSHVPHTQIKSMQRAIRRLIPRIIYSPPGSHHLNQDAFSIALECFLIHHKPISNSI
ncbi:hypothetical protein GOP47_0011691 [Adiantum capillus-veneris]|uniref:Exostosin GT47 domain-containing protein n=1 Tax=Adiantum capillus-veneris TaxID=13818 RepID=A0A9D4UT91_ADICA|nr:hypothetical protein GOP47_0011691 [Adiantum capillus-veneris]